MNNRNKYGAAIILPIMIISFYLSFCSRVDIKDKESCFKRYVCDPIPGTVKITTVKGAVSIAGGYLVIVFDIDKEDLKKLIKDNNYLLSDEAMLKIQSASVTKSDSLKAANGDALKYGIVVNSIYMKSESNGARAWRILVNKENNKAYFFYFST